METNITIPDKTIINKIYLIRGQKVMLDFDLSELYGVETKQLKRQVRRNIERFPEDFLFDLTKEEMENMRCQFGTSRWGGARYSSMAFTEQGVAMLSSVLNSKRAIETNIRIIRIFTKLREMVLNNKDLLIKLEKYEKKILKQDNFLEKHEKEIQIIFKALKQLLNPPSQVNRKQIGFKQAN